MQCPKCESTRFKPFKTSEHLEVEFCGDCGLIWFESGELAEMTEASVDMPHLQESLKSATATEFECPLCDDQELVEIPYHPEEPLRVEYCRACHGILLDRNEVPVVEELLARRQLGKKLMQVIQELKSRGFVRLR